MGVGTTDEPTIEFQTITKHITARFTQLNDMLKIDSKLVAIFPEEFFSPPEEEWAGGWCVSIEIGEYAESWFFKLRKKYGHSRVKMVKLEDFGDKARENDYEMFVWAASARNWNVTDALFMGSKPIINMGGCRQARKFSRDHYRFGTFGVVTTPIKGVQGLFRTDPDHANYLPGDWKKRAPLGKEARAAKADQNARDAASRAFFSWLLPVMGVTVIVALLAIAFRLVY